MKPQLPIAVAFVLIDRKGRVRYSNLGDDLEQRIQELLDEGKQ